MRKPVFFSWPDYYSWPHSSCIVVVQNTLGTLSKTAEDGDGNVGKTNYTRQKAHVNM